MRKGRLFQVICYLLEKGQGTAADMAREFGVSVRTVYRDVETLNAAGIPIYAETGRSGGICLMKGFVLDRAMLSREERGDILQKVRAREEELSKSGPAALQKLAAMFELPAGEWLDVDLAAGGGVARAAERFSFLQRAVMQHHYADITFAGDGGEPVKLSVMPLGLSCRWDGWYLKACCPESGEYRLLPLSRIVKWKPSAAAFEPRSFPEEKPGPQRETVRVLARFPAELAGRVYGAFDGSLITLRKDGFLELRQDMPADEDLIGRLLSLGPKARVISPASLKEEIARRAREIYEAYR